MTVVPSPDLPGAPVFPVLPVLPVAPCGPDGPGTITGVVGTVTTAGLSQALKLSVASRAEMSIMRFMRNPLNIKKCSGLF